jgi:mono/diheme cytochrome c family protein
LREDRENAKNSNPWRKDREMSTLLKLGSGFLLCFCAAGACAQPAQPTLTLTVGAITNHFTAAELLSRPDLASLQIPAGVDYDMQLTVQAVPLLDLLATFPLERFDRLEATATDGFVAQIPLALIVAGKSGGSVAWVAIEDPAHPWPRMRGKDVSAGPFYLVWQYPERSQVANEQWPYMLEKLTAVQSPEVRWPQLKVNETLPANAPARSGEAIFATQCLPCHRLNGGGGSGIGPDLGQPMAATDYMTERGLRALVRDPKSVRTWPQQQMPAFSPAILPDADLEALIAYLKQIASQRGR